MNSYTYVIGAEYEGKRIDIYLSEIIEDCSRSYIQKLIEEEKIKVNNRIIKSNYKLKCNDLISLEIPDETPMEILAEDIPLDILYEDKDIIVINKAQGMVVHPAAGHYSGTLVNALLFHCPNELSKVNGPLRARDSSSD